VAARECGASVSNLGSLFYEGMSCAGYDDLSDVWPDPEGPINPVLGFDANRLQLRADLGERAELRIRLDQ
jgi:hypothetical protein